MGFKDQERKLSIIIVNYNAPDALEKCLASIDAHVHLGKEVLVIDNNSRDERLDALQQSHNDLRVIRLTKNMGFGYANNVGVRNARGEIILFLNSDTEIVDDGINDAIIKFSTTRERQMWGFRLQWPDGNFQNSFSRETAYIDFILCHTELKYCDRYIERIRDYKYRDNTFHKITEVGVVYAAAFLMWREDFSKLNGFDDRYFMYYEDIDLCDRFRQVLGGRIYYYPFATIIHGVQGSSDGSARIRLEQLKSMYRYGFDKYGPARAIFFLLIHLSVHVMRLLYRLVKRLVRMLAGADRDRTDQGSRPSGMIGG